MTSTEPPDPLWPDYRHPDDLRAIEAVPLAERGLPESTYTLLTRAAAAWPERTALTVLPHGGYAVDVVEGGARHRVPVTPGLFSDSLVEVSGTGLHEGQSVEVPSSFWRTENDGLVPTQSAMTGQSVTNQVTSFVPGMWSTVTTTAGPSPPMKSCTASP